MKIIDIHAEEAFEQVIEAIHEGAMILQLPPVFGLFAAPTQRGVDQLNRAKSRLPNKHYGTLIGSLERFLKQAESATIPPELSTPDALSAFSDAIIRVHVGDPDFTSPTIRAGTHQGLLLSGIFHELATAIERSFVDHAIDPIWGGKHISAAVCSSCNLSGHPDGAITELERAIAFGKERGIELLVRADMLADARGSYPIIGLEERGVVIHREGPGLERLQRLVPAHLRSW